MSWRELGDFCTLSFFFNVGGSLLIIIGELHVSSGISSLLMAFEPLCAAALCYILIPSTKPTLRSLFGLVLGMVGLIMVVTPQFLGEHGKEPVTPVMQRFPDWFYVGALLVSAISLGWANVRIQQMKMTTPIHFRLCGQLTFAFIQIFILHLCLSAANWPEGYATNLSELGTLFGSLPTKIWLFAVLLLGPIDTALIYALYYALVPHLGYRVTLSGFGIPVVALLLGIVVHSEWEGVAGWAKILEVVGLMTVFAGIYLILQDSEATHNSPSTKIGRASFYSSLSTATEGMHAPVLPRRNTTEFGSYTPIVTPEVVPISKSFLKRSKAVGIGNSATPPVFRGSFYTPPYMNLDEDYMALSAKQSITPKSSTINVVTV